MNIHRKETRAPYHPQKGCEYGSTKAIVRSVVTAAGGPKEVASRIKLRMSQVYNYLDPDHPSQMSFAALRDLSGPRNRAAAEDLARQVNCALVPLETPDAPFPELAAQAARSNGEFAAAVMMAQADCVITATETALLLTHIDDAMRHLGDARAAAIARLKGL